MLAAAGNGAQLLLAVRAVASQLEYSDSSSDARRLQDRLSDVHSCIVAVDDALDSLSLTTGWCLSQRQRICRIRMQKCAAAAELAASLCVQQ